MSEIFSSIAQSIAGLFSIEGIVGFILGMVFEYVFLKLRCRYIDKVDPKGRPHKVRIKRSYWVWALIFIVMGGIAYKNQDTYDRLTKCSKEFYAALDSRAKINNEKFAMDTRWQVATYNRTVELGNMLREYGSASDPRYQERKMVIDLRYADEVSAIFKEQQEIAEKRAQTPYPEPTCGR